MTDREKLIELLDEATDKLKELCGGYNDGTGNTVRADHLIAHGVTFATDTNDGDKMTPTDKDTNVLTNADRIRAMSDEELAEYFAEIGNDASNGISYSENPEEWLEWLKQPAEVDHE